MWRVLIYGDIATHLNGSIIEYPTKVEAQTFVSVNNLASFSKIINTENPEGEQAKAIVEAIRTQNRPLTTDEICDNLNPDLVWVFCLNDLVSMGYLVQTNTTKRCSKARFGIGPREVRV